ncbi:hypothetical protein, partial [Streptosporangium minutum]|uniref:hypothetical protein n=1 Tax=Streptosporangium minutum TaxID=569862 RepID=UPI001A980AF4
GWRRITVLCVISQIDGQYSYKRYGLPIEIFPPYVFARFHDTHGDSGQGHGMKHPHRAGLGDTDLRE